MSNKPWMPLYVGDYIRDTRHLSQGQHGAFLLLICHQWVTGKPIPLDENQIFRITGGFSEAEKNDTLFILNEFFEKTANGYINRKVESVREVQEARSEIASENGKKGGRPKKNPEQNLEESQKKAKENPEPNPEESFQSQSQSQSQISNSEKKAVVVSENLSTAASRNNNGVYFSIKRPFEHISEEDWLQRQLVEDIRHREKKQVDPALSLHELGVMYYGAKKRIHNWLSNPIEKRMAAFIYAASKPNLNGELSYATKSIQDNYDGYLKYLPITEEMVKQQDFEVEIDG